MDLACTLMQLSSRRGWAGGGVRPLQRRGGRAIQGSVLLPSVLLGAGPRPCPSALCREVCTGPAGLLPLLVFSQLKKCRFLLSSQPRTGDFPPWPVMNPKSTPQGTPSWRCGLVPPRPLWVSLPSLSLYLHRFSALVTGTCSALPSLSCGRLWGATRQLWNSSTAPPP